MDFRQLETFVEVAKLKSFSKAAEKLFITQPTVTNHIQNLEKELGTLLINRFGKKITLTDAGNLLYKYAINILNSCEMAKFDLASYQGKIQGHLHIYSSSVPRKYLLPTIIKNFLNHYPDVSFTVGDKDSKKVVRGILDGETDFGILGAKFSSNNLKYIDLMEDRLVLITPNSPKFPGDNFSYIEKDVLFREKIMFREEGSGTRALVENIFEKAKLPISKLNIAAYVEDTEAIKELVSLGIGISFLSEKAVQNDLILEKYKVFYVEDLEFIRKFYFAFHKSRQLSPLSEAFKNYILEFVKDQKI
ncbi:LysR family transcriptional regulator [Tissierella sp. P1]|uniref:selenium metabolism-associated LysR family transcriptional regulator n=1 Tax=Tissierella sp. P1 TaxID=1280483 RepID=UPI000BA12E88|nr:selenium metabolism-associated LysR family transcriptional regulator [Tissierella sp. P1]MDU5083542.1 selenium metabolism-associated LysR family transcriptional regulator [Bacillota bacterium]OZV11886.1 LysR family transcriptional regulator [Tissierella sp. P1]